MILLELTGMLSVLWVYLLGRQLRPAMVKVRVKK